MFDALMLKVLLARSAGCQEYLSRGFPWTLLLQSMPIPMRHALEPNAS
jgi:hypothetical protein